MSQACDDNMATPSTTHGKAKGIMIFSPSGAAVITRLISLHVAQIHIFAIFGARGEEVRG
eukprot:2785585-Karenia_brevis.AAC.1